MRRIRTAAMLLTCLISLAGCTPQSTAPGGSTPPAMPVTQSTSGPSDQRATIQLADWPGIEKLVAAHSGKVVVVDFWSTWCTPCIAEFPHLVELHEQHGGKVACVSVNCNYAGGTDEPPESFRTDVEKFLNDKRTFFENVISTEPDTNVLEHLSAASVPVVRVYDRQGKLRKQFVNDNSPYGDEGFSYEKHIGPLVAELIAETAEVGDATK